MSWKDEVKKNQPDDYDEYQDEMERNRALAWLKTDVNDIINDLESVLDNLEDVKGISLGDIGDIKRLSKTIGEVRADLQDWI